MSINKHHNLTYDGNIPEAVGDRYYAQDLLRDVLYNRDKTGEAFTDIMGTLPILLDGGATTQGAGLSLNITAGFGYVEFGVEIPDDFATLPPAKLSATLTAVRVTWPNQTSINAGSPKVTTYAPVNDGATVNYAKLRYIEADGNTRTKARVVGTYSYEVIEDYEIIVDDTAPTNLDLVVAQFTSDGATYTFTEYTTNKISYDNFTEASTGIETNTASIISNDTDIDFLNSQFVNISANFWRLENASNNSFAWNSLDFGGGTFMAVSSDTGSTQKVMRSTNAGQTWTGLSGAETHSWNDIVYGDGQFMLIAAANNAGSPNTSQALFTTNGGDSFTAATPPGGGWNSITYINDTFIASGSTGDTVIWNTRGETTWTETAALGSSVNIQAVDALQNSVMAGGGTGRLFRSTNNGATWSEVTSPTSSAMNSFASSPTTAIGTTNLGQTIVSTDDGASWSLGPAAGVNPRRINYHNGVWVMVSDTSIAISIDEGQNWELISPPQTNIWRNVVFGQGVWVAVSSSGAIRVMRSLPLRVQGA